VRDLVLEAAAGAGAGLTFNNGHGVLVMTLSKSSSHKYRRRPDLSPLITEAQRTGTARELLSHLNELAEQGDGDALAVLGTLYEDGLHAANRQTLIEPDASAAKRYTERAAALGNPPAMTRVADELSASSSAAAKRRAVGLYTAAARRRYPAAAYNLAMTYLQTSAYPEAVGWFRRAAVLGYDMARVQLALAQFHGLGIRRNPTAALQKLLKLVRVGAISDFDRGDILVFVANALREGWVVRRDNERALRVLRDAAEIGSEAAKGLLADLGDG
jgi:TPR repeat protein